MVEVAELVDAPVCETGSQKRVRDRAPSFTPLKFMAIARNIGKVLRRPRSAI